MSRVVPAGGVGAGRVAAGRDAAGRVGARAVGAGAVGAAALALHAARNARLLRVPPPVARRAVRTAPAEGAVTRTGTDVAHRPRVSVLIPARDEADRVGSCVRAVLASRGVDFEVCVLDDSSADDTAGVARAAAAGDMRLRLLTGPSLPAGWLGKPHACQQLAEAARGEVLVFLDADVELAPDGLARTVAAVDSGPYDLVCPYPRQVAEGPGPRLLQPLLQWSWLTFLPLGVAERHPRPSLVAANGQLAACRAAHYHRAGGHAAVRHAVLDDLELGRAFVRAGLIAGVMDGTDVAACRMYRSWAETRDGYAKSLWAAFGSPAGAGGAAALLAWLFVLPPLAGVVGLLRRRPRLALPGLAGYAAGVTGRMIAASRTGGRVGDAYAHPVSVAALLWLLGLSWQRRLRGQLEWRGRSVAPPLGGAPSPPRAQ